MIRPYNGNVNRRVIRDLRKLCPFTGCLDEMPTIVLPKSEEDIEKYLKEDFLERLKNYLDYKKPAEDYLLSSLIEFLRCNAKFPEKDEMRQLEEAAEAKRIADLPPEARVVPKEITKEDIVKEILELAEEIMESRRENNPNAVRVPVEPYPESCWIETGEFQCNILYQSCDGVGDFRDYSCEINVRNGYHLTIEYCSDTTCTVTAKDWLDRTIKLPLTKYLITIHKGIAKTAKEEGIEFISEIDYDKFDVA